MNMIYHATTIFAGFSSRDQIFQQSRDSSALTKIYETYLSNELLSSRNNQLTLIGALIIEPGR